MELKPLILLLGNLSVLTLTALPSSAAVFEYEFSGPSVSGRFVVEGYDGPAGSVWNTSFGGHPYLFTATAGHLSYTTDIFALEVWNEFPAFGLSDRYVLSGAGNNLELGLLGPSIRAPYPSTLPHDLSAYSGLALVRMWDPAAGNFAEFHIDTLTQVPEPGALSVFGGLMAGVLGMRWAGRRRQAGPIAH